VTNGECGCVVEPNDIEGMADKIIMLLQDKEMYNRMAVSAARRYEEKFNQPAWEQAMEDVHAKLLSR
jgi:glycosyltransferase involved in cell wall biosynthesis